MFLGNYIVTLKTYYDFLLCKIRVDEVNEFTP